MFHFIFSVISCFVFLLPLASFAYEFTILDPTSATVRGTFNAAGTLAAGTDEKLSFAAIEIFNDTGTWGSAVNFWGCLGLQSCTVDYELINGKPLDLPHGSYSIRLNAFVHITNPSNVAGATQYGPTQLVFVDRTPELTVSSAPSGSVSYPLRVTGVATFTPTLAAIKGMIDVAACNHNHSGAQSSHFSAHFI